MPPVHHKFADADEALRALHEVHVAYSRQRNWKPLKGANQKLLDVVRWFLDHHDWVPYSVMTVVALALGIKADADRRDRASFCAHVEGHALAVGVRLTAADLAERFDVSERTIGEWRGDPQYPRWRDAARRFRQAGVIEPRELSFPKVPTASVARLPDDLSGRRARKAVFDLMAAASRAHEAPDETVLRALAEALRLSAPQK